jgi:hypothetical protein
LVTSIVQPIKLKTNCLIRYSISSTMRMRMLRLSFFQIEA